jgi:hypothetical protein
MRGKVIVVNDTVAGWKQAMEEMDSALRKGGGVGFDLTALGKDRQRDFMHVVDVKGRILYGNTRK